MNSAIGKIFDTILEFINMFRFWVVLYAFEEGIILRMGKLHKKVGPGFHWRLPLSIDQLFWLNVRKKTTDSWEMALTTKCGKTITISFDMVMEVHDAEKALLRVDDWVAVAYTTAKIALSTMVANSNYSEVMAANYSNKVHAIVNLALKDFGITICTFGITDKANTKAYKLFLGACK